MLLLGSLFQIAAFSIQFLEPSFPLFVLSFGLGGIGIAFQVSIHRQRKRVGNNARDPSLPSFFLSSRMRLRTASLQLFKMILNIKWVSYMLHMVHPFPQCLSFIRLTLIRRRWSISRSPFRYLLLSTSNAMVLPLSYIPFLGSFQHCHSCGSL